MQIIYAFFGLGGGFVFGFILLITAAFVRLSVMRPLRIIGWLTIVAQCGAWMCFGSVASMCCGHGGPTADSFIPWIIIALFVLAAAFVWTRLFLRIR